MLSPTTRRWVARIDVMVIAVSAVFISGILEAQSGEKDLENEKQYQEQMREIEHSFEVLTQHSELPSQDQARDEAAQLVSLFDRVERFWKGRGDEQKAGFASMASDGAEAAVDALKKNERAALDAAMGTIAAACEGCHVEPLDKYRIPR